MPRICEGTVRTWLREKGFGFIQPSNGDEEVFVHQSEVQSSGFRSLDIGETVEFEIVEERGRRKAYNVTGTS